MDNGLGFADEELDALRVRGFGFHYYGPDSSRLTEVVAIYRRNDVADIAIIRGPDEGQTIAYRALVSSDILDPQTVAGFYVGNARWALRWLMTLDPPTLTPSLHMEFPPGLGIPQDRRVPVNIRAQRQVPIRHTVGP
jgi:hypothetical protein